jgi:hypothetical protein
MVIYVDRACNCISDRLSLLMVIYVDRACNCTSDWLSLLIPTLSTYVTTIRLSRSDIQYDPIYMLPWEDSVIQIYNYRYCISDRLSLRMVIYVDRACNCISDRLSLLMVIYVDRACNCTSDWRSDIQYWPYLPMFEWKDPVHQMYNTESMYICYHDKTQSIRYTIPIISTYVTKRRLSESDIQYLIVHLIDWVFSWKHMYIGSALYIWWTESSHENICR